MLDMIADTNLRSSAELEIYNYILKNKIGSLSWKFKLKIKRFLDTSKILSKSSLAEFQGTTRIINKHTLKRGRVLMLEHDNYVG